MWRCCAAGRRVCGARRRRGRRVDSPPGTRPRGPRPVGLQGPSGGLGTVARRLGSLEACRGLSSPPQPAPEDAAVAAFHRPGVGRAGAAPAALELPGALWHRGDDERRGRLKPPGERLMGQCSPRALATRPSATHPMHCPGGRDSRVSRCMPSGASRSSLIQKAEKLSSYAPAQSGAPT